MPALPGTKRSAGACAVVLFAEALEDQSGIVAAEAEAIRHDCVHLHIVAGLVGDVVEIAARIRIV